MTPQRPALASCPVDPTAVHTASMKTTTDRNARLELRLRADEKDSLAKAAELGGEDTSQFVRRVSIIAARELLARLRK